MKAVTRGELLGLAEYEEIREPFRHRVIELKRVRRVPLGPNMTVLFENHDTVLFQIQEMLRTERITAEKAILHELETYNELVPGERELSATIFIEYPDSTERTRMLTALAGVEDRFFLQVAGERLPVIGDARARAPEQTVAVHYVKFPLTESAEEQLHLNDVKVEIGVQHPYYEAKTELGRVTIASLREDLMG